MNPFACDLAALTVQASPFPHATVDNIFPSDVFAALEHGYPNCPPASGPTGHTIHRGDAEFAAVMTEHPTWRAVFEACNSPAFVDSLATLFAAELARSCQLEQNHLYLVDRVETRAEKEHSRIPTLGLPPEAIFVRFDFMQGKNAYVRRPHVDHRRRLVTMLIYFDAPGEATFLGGDLILHDQRGKAIGRIAPAVNRAVLFPCSERSWHSVDAVSGCRQPRRFVQISVSSGHDIWPAAQLRPRGGALAWARRLLTTRAKIRSQADFGQL